MSSKSVSLEEVTTKDRIKPVEQDVVSLEEVTTKDRIKLVEQDVVRKYGQIVIAFVLIGSMLAYLGWYTITQADAEFKLSLAEDFRVLVIMGMGAALAIFGLGRTVGKKK